MTVEEVRVRNWQKARLMGFYIDKNVLTPQERIVFDRLIAIRNLMLERWDDNTEILIGHPLPPYKCEICGKRSNKEYRFINPLGRDESLCAKHFKLFKSDDI